MFSIQIAKHAFKKDVFTCFGSVPQKLLSMLLKKKFLHALVLCHRNLGVFGEGSKMFKMTLSKQVEGLVLRFLNKFLLESIEYFMSWALFRRYENISSDFIFPLYWKLDFQNWYFLDFGTLQKIRYATVVSMVSYVACLTGFLKFQKFDGHKFIFRKSRGKIEKSTLKSDFTPNFQHCPFFYLKLQQLEISHY